jgi:hypothetical protein
VASAELCLRNAATVDELTTADGALVRLALLCGALCRFALASLVRSGLTVMRCGVVIAGRLGATATDAAGTTGSAGSATRCAAGSTGSAGTTTRCAAGSTGSAGTTTGSAAGSTSAAGSAARCASKLETNCNRHVIRP